MPVVGHYSQAKLHNHQYFPASFNTLRFPSMPSFPLLLAHVFSLFFCFVLANTLLWEESLFNLKLELTGDQFFSTQHEAFPLGPSTLGIVSHQLLLLFKSFLFIFTCFPISCSFPVIMLLWIHLYFSTWDLLLFNELQSRHFLSHLRKSCSCLLQMLCFIVYISSRSLLIWLGVDTQF